MVSQTVLNLTGASRIVSSAIVCLVQDDLKTGLCFSGRRKAGRDAVAYLVSYPPGN